MALDPAARATRFPDNPAFYWYYGGYRPEVDAATTVVRPDLTYEDAVQFEAGFAYTAPCGVQVAVNAYQYDVDDYIRWIFGYMPSRVVYNIDEVRFQGLEGSTGQGIRFGRGGEPVRRRLPGGVRLSGAGADLLLRAGGPVLGVHPTAERLLLKR